MRRWELEAVTFSDSMMVMWLVCVVVFLMFEVSLMLEVSLLVSNTYTFFAIESMKLKDQNLLRVKPNGCSVLKILFRS